MNNSVLKRLIDVFSFICGRSAPAGKPDEEGRAGFETAAQMLMKMFD